MDELNKPTAYHQRLLSGFDEYFTSSHILLAGWCSVSLLFFILAFNSSVSINILVVKLICLCLSISIVILAYRSFLLMGFKYKRLIILTKNKEDRDIIKRSVIISYILSFTFFFTTIIIFIAFAFGLHHMSKNGKINRNT
tara:strand:+ start:275 stop:694 length:420 start_codon:yes stop_codon:yes gene_type:complete